MRDFHLLTFIWLPNLHYNSLFFDWLTNDIFIVVVNVNCFILVSFFNSAMVQIYFWEISFATFSCISSFSCKYFKLFGNFFMCKISVFVQQKFMQKKMQCFSFKWILFIRLFSHWKKKFVNFWHAEHTIFGSNVLIISWSILM